MRRGIVLAGLVLAVGLAAAKDDTKPAVKKRLLVITESRGFVHDVVRRGKGGELCLVEKTLIDIGQRSGDFEAVCSQDSRKAITAENLKDFGTFIPGYRPGRRTAEYLEKVMIRITYVGAAFLAVVAIVPTVISASMHVQPNIASFYGGTGLLIAVSVAFDLIQKIDSHLVMRDYRGLLEP